MGLVDEDRLRRHDLTDGEWTRLEPLLPAHPRQGHRWNDHRLVIDGIFFRTRAGCPWRDLPERSGNWKTVYNRHRRWSETGPGRRRSWTTFRAGCGGAEGRRGRSWRMQRWVRAHQHAAGARHRLPADVDPARLAPAALSSPVRIRD